MSESVHVMIGPRFLVMKVSGDKLQTMGPNAAPMSHEAADAEARRFCAAARDETFVLVEMVTEYTWEPAVATRRLRSGPA